MTHTLSPEDTDSRLKRPAWMPADDPTRFIPVSRLPRPEATAVIYLKQPEPPRQFVVLPDRALPPVPAADLTTTEPFEPIGPDVVPLRTEPEPLRPALYRGKRRAASLLPPWAWMLIGAIVALVVTR